MNGTEYNAVNNRASVRMPGENTNVYAPGGTLDNFNNNQNQEMGGQAVVQPQVHQAEPVQAQGANNVTQQYVQPQIVEQLRSQPTQKASLEAVYVDGEYPLPVGYIDNLGQLHKTIRLKPMTGKSDEAIAEPKVRENGGKLVTELIFGVTDGIGTLNRVSKDVIRGLTVADRDYILVKNRIYSLGEMAEYQDKCSHCGGINTIRTNLNDLPVNFLDDNSPRELTFDLINGVQNSRGEICKRITVVMPTGVVQERIAPIARVNPAQATTAMLHMITKSIDGIDFLNPDLFRNMTKKDRDYISKRLAEFNAGVNLTITTVCAECGEEFETTIPLNALLGE